MCKLTIRNPYAPESEEKKLLGEVHTKGSWKDGRFNNFKENLIAHLRIEQEFFCCYCKLVLSGATNQTHIEHIIAKNNNARFTYSVKNLALCCINCNTTKSYKPVYQGKGDESDLKRLPANSGSYLIVHPHLDLYDQHVEFFAGAIAREVNDSEKGRNLIEMCNLHRFGLVYDKSVEEVMKRKSKAHKKIVKLVEAKKSEQLIIIDEFIEELFDFVDE